MKTVLTIAGSDSSGGAGIQADIKTITMHGLYAMSAITALTAQNTTGVYGILDSTEEFLASQLDCIFTDIYPDAVKIGMVSHAGLIHTIGEKLKEYKAKNVVLDPVMVSTSGFKLLKDEAAEALMKELILFQHRHRAAFGLPGVAPCGREHQFVGRRAVAGGAAVCHESGVFVRGRRRGTARVFVRAALWREGRVHRDIPLRFHLLQRGLRRAGPH